jgi:hypothetical protein
MNSTSTPPWLAALTLPPGPTPPVFSAPTNSDYTNLGWVLTQVNGKTPVAKKWQLRQNCFDANNPPNPSMGVGLCHAYSGTVSVDVDHWQRAETELALSGINLQALFDAPDAVTIESGRAGHGKLLYRMSPNLVLNSKKLIDRGPDGKPFNFIDFRCGTSNGGTVQDVLPGAAIHPDTGKPYRWAGKGHYTRLPVIPEALLAFWLRLLKKDSERRIQSGDGVDASWDEIRSALKFISPDVSRKEWVDVGMALQWAGEQTDQLDEAYQIWCEWSEQSSKFKPSEMPTQWASFSTNKGNLVKLGTLYRMARQGGWVRPAIDASELFSAVPAGADAAPAAGHPLARYQPIGSEIKPTEFVLEDCIPDHGITMLAGAQGAGKTSNLVPLLAAAAHLCPLSHPLRPSRARRVVWITEDRPQVELILHAIVSMRWATLDQVRDMFKIVDARRMPATEIVKASDEWARLSIDHENDDGEVISLKPVIVLDTFNSTVQVTSENDNSEVGAAIAAVKQHLSGFAVLIITHLAKALKDRTSLNELSARGGGALEGDVNKVLYLVNEDGERYMLHGKTRFEIPSQKREIKFVPYTTQVLAKGNFSTRLQTLRCSLAQFADQSEREQIKAQTKANKRELNTALNASRMVEEMLSVLALAHDDRRAVNRSALYEKVTGSNTQKKRVLDELIEAGRVANWFPCNDFYERVGISNEKSVLLATTATEQDHWRKTGNMPEAVSARTQASKLGGTDTH